MLGSCCPICMVTLTPCTAISRVGASNLLQALPDVPHKDLIALSVPDVLPPHAGHARVPHLGQIRPQSHGKGLRHLHPSSSILICNS